MAVESTAEATWTGDLMSGNGTVHAGSGAFPDQALTWRARAESRESGTSPEELIAAAHAACFAMALSFGLGQAGHPPERLDTSARVQFQPGPGITAIHLTVRGRVPGLDAEAFRQAAEGAKANCPVSKALAGVPDITLDASLEG
ncbi:MAG TPA: OsmC family peroxiredoxin [Candidatus Dormibacteraeota bacterium]|nr:OsmC family peroxiredoxin [Candidatus Dormibacteraeota bacterium]